MELHCKPDFVNKGIFLALLSSHLTIYVHLIDVFGQHSITTLFHIILPTTSNAMSMLMVE